MPKSDFQKAKILYILDYLRANSSPRHPVNATQLIEMLDKYGIHADRKTIFSDIETLELYGVSLERVRGRNGGYYVNERTFETWELSLLVGAVQCSKYLDEKTSRELIDKLLNEFGHTEARRLKSTMFVQGRIKSMNDSIYANVDIIQQALMDAKKITFRYFDWNTSRRRVYRKNASGAVKTYEVSPYGLCQSNENCYLIARSADHEGRPVHYRVDRMSDLAISKEKREPCPELTGTALNEYVKKQFNMYSGEVTTVKMRFRNSLANVVLDTFDQGVMLMRHDKDWFNVTAEVAVSPQFLGWIVGLGDAVQILQPQSVIDDCRNWCRKVLQVYEPDQT